MMAPGAPASVRRMFARSRSHRGHSAPPRNHDVSYAAVARAPIGEIEVVRKRMDWTFLWVSSFRSDFNYDFDVSFKAEDVAAGRAHYNFGPRPNGPQRCKTCRAGHLLQERNWRDLPHLFGVRPRRRRGAWYTTGILDATPKGRNETGPYHTLGDWAQPTQYVREGRRSGGQRPLSRAFLRLLGACRI